METPPKPKQNGPPKLEERKTKKQKQIDARRKEYEAENPVGVVQTPAKRL